MSFFKLRKMESIAVIVGTIVAVIVAICQLCSHDDPPPPGDKFPRFAEISDITSAMQGEKIDTRGVVTILNENKGNVYNGELEIKVWQVYL